MKYKQVLEEIVKNKGRCATIKGLECWDCPLEKECKMMMLPDDKLKLAKFKLENNYKD